MKPKPFVIAINAVGAGGKTALSTRLHGALPGSVLLCFDDFDDTNVYPVDYYEWSRRGANLLEFDCPGMAAAVEEAQSNGDVDYIVLDYPFGRDHPRLRNFIDLSVFIDTPLDVALARRILRDYPESSGIAPEELLRHLRMNLAHYVEKARYPFLDAQHRKNTSDLVLNGWLGLEELTNQILDHIRSVRGGTLGV